MASQLVLANANNITMHQQHYRHCNASHVIQIVLLAQDHQITAKLATNLHRWQQLQNHVHALLGTTFRFQTHLSAQSAMKTVLLAAVLRQHALLANKTQHWHPTMHVPAIMASSMLITPAKNAVQNAKLVRILLSSVLHASPIQLMTPAQINVSAYLALTGTIWICRSASHATRAARNAAGHPTNLVLNAVKMQRSTQPLRNAFATMDSIKTTTPVISAWLVIRHAQLAVEVMRIAAWLVNHMRSHARPLLQSIRVPAKMDLWWITQLGIAMPAIQNALHAMELLLITASHVS